ncbi:hypothetical protein TWF694_011364 [Orbilia ellipsospora]|uniref:RTA1-domain-containing protein n=1 Tax=Orbilia ellipsospora TaxID=2528407 RepID=A0AAV9X517_9PEZI
MGETLTLYPYHPSEAAAILFAVLYGLTSALHTYQLVRTKTWFFIAFTIGGWFEMIGYVARIVSVNQYPNNTKPPFIINTIFPLVAPALFSASIYMAFGCILVVTKGEKYSIVRPSWLTKIFVFGDVASFVLVGIGGSMVATAFSDISRLNLGTHIVEAGLVVQLVFFSVFMLTATIFNVRIVKNPTEKVQTTSSPYQKHLNALYGASFLILARSIFKLIQYVEGKTSHLSLHEWWSYFFDAALMFLAMIIFHFIHPSELRALREGGQVISKVVLVKKQEQTEKFLDEEREATPEAAASNV